MSIYLGQAELATDGQFTQRVAACVQQETGAWQDPPVKSVREITAEIMPAVASAPGFAQSYLWGDEPSGTLPGHAAISDGEILSTVQPLLDQYRPA